MRSASRLSRKAVRRCSHSRSLSAGLAPSFEQTLDNVFSAALSDSRLAFPGFNVHARRGADVYAKSFGVADLESGAPWQADAMVRMYSMTKVMASALALRLHELGALDFEAPVADWIPSFDRQWDIVAECDITGDETLSYVNAIDGSTHEIEYTRTPSAQPMLVKHLMSETSGIGYDVFSDFDQAFGGFGTKNSYAIASALRREVVPTVYSPIAGRVYVSGVAPTVYSSKCILGHDMDVEEFCEVIAEAGVLVCEPGTFSYGLGATVLGRVIELAHAKHFGGSSNFEQIMRELIWMPCGMDAAAFFLEDGDPRAQRIPTLYAATLEESGMAAVVRAERYGDGLAADDGIAYTNHTDHAGGPREYLSGDTGSLMPVSDYAKFVELLLSGGVAASGERVLAPQSVSSLTRGRFEGLNLETQMAHNFGVAGDGGAFPSSFNYGWATNHAGTIAARNVKVPAHEVASATCNWSGYANTHVRVYPDDDAFIILAPQMMDNSAGGFTHAADVLRVPALAAFTGLWT